MEAGSPVSGTSLLPLFHQESPDVVTDYVALLQALADKIIPGLPPSLRVHIVTQIDENDQASSSDSKSMTVLEHVLDGHTERKRALQQKAGECPSKEIDAAHAHLLIPHQL